MTAEELQFFEGHAAALPAYERFRRAVLQRLPQAQIRVQKSQISFYNRHMFACVSFVRVKKLAPEEIVVSFGLPAPVASPRIAAAVQPAKNRWTHHVCATAQQVDAQLLGWLAQAAAFSDAKR